MSLVYAGQFLRIDLSTATVATYEIDDADVRAYLLGSGHAAKLFYDEMDPVYLDISGKEEPGFVVVNDVRLS